MCGRRTITMLYSVDSVCRCDRGWLVWIGRPVMTWMLAGLDPKLARCVMRQKNCIVTKFYLIAASMYSSSAAGLGGRCIDPQRTCCCRLDTTTVRVRGRRILDRMHIAAPPLEPLLLGPTAAYRKVRSSVRFCFCSTLQ